MVVVYADFDDERAFLMKQNNFVFRPTTRCFLQLGLEVLDKYFDLLRVYRDNIVVRLEMCGQFFEGYGAAVGCDWTGHCVEFADFLVLHPR